MAQKILILGNSGTGKSASMRNFTPDEIAVINCAGKPLPFRNKFEQYTPRFDKLTSDVLAAMDKTTKKVIVVDDAQYIMSFQYMRRIHENGWDKWNDIQGDFFTIIQACDYMPDDVIVYFLSHLTKDDDGNEKIKTMGKMLDEKITIEGLFTTVLKTSVSDGKYFFLTQNSGKDTVKSPIGMFETYAIDNDLKYVDTKIRNYYEIGNFVPDEKIKEMDAQHVAPEVEKPDSDGRKRRRGRPKKSEVAEVVKDENENAQQEKPEQEQAETATETAAEEKPKRKYTRKKRESVAEQAENVADPGETAAETPETVAEPEKPKRRRRRKAAETAENVDIAKMEMPADDELPF